MHCMFWNIIDLHSKVCCFRSVNSTICVMFIFYRMLCCILNKQFRTAKKCFRTDCIFNELLVSLRRTNKLELTLSQWKYVNNRKQTWSGTLIVRCLCMPGLLKVVATELANYRLDFVVVEGFKSKKLGTEWAVDFSFFFFFEKRFESKIRYRICVLPE